jgi:hypothetical protein
MAFKYDPKRFLTEDEAGQLVEQIYVDSLMIKTHGI